MTDRLRFEGCRRETFRASWKIVLPLGAALILLLTGCAQDSDAFHVEFERQRAEGFCCYGDEGEITFVEIRDEDGSVLASEGFAAPTESDYPSELSLDLRPGTYRIEAYFRYCAGTCESLNPRVSETPTCLTKIAGDRGHDRSVVVFTDDSGCTIRTMK